MDAGWPFLFKLHAPLNFVVGGGFFVRFTALPCFLAWAAFREKNGASTLLELVQRVARYRKTPQTPSSSIGCNVLTDPFFFDEDEWIPIPPDWAPNIVRGRTYDTTTETGNALWQAVLERLVTRVRATTVEEPRFGDAYLARARLD